MKDISKILDTQYRLDKKHDEYYERFIDRLKTIVTEPDPPYTLNNTFTEYFARHFIYGKEIYDNINNFNNKIISKIKSDEKLLNALLRGNSNELIQDNFKLSNGKRTTLGSVRRATTPGVSRFPNTIDFYMNTRNLPLRNKIVRDVEVDNQDINNMIIDNYLGYSAILNMYYTGSRNNYLSDICDISNNCDNCLIGVSNYKDKDGIVNQAIEIAIMCMDSSTIDSSIIFYYSSNPEDPVFDYNDPENCILLSENSFVMPHMYHENPEITFRGKNRCKTYKFARPIFDDDDLQFLRVLEWTSYRQGMESDGDTKFYREKVKFLENNGLEHRTAIKKVCADYPFLGYTRDQEESNLFITNWRIKMYMSKVNEILTRLVEQIHDNQITQCNDYLHDGFISSRDALIPSILNNKDYIHPFNNPQESEERVKRRITRLGAIEKIYRKNYEYLSEFVLDRLRKEYIDG